jgi:hypothetical protein
MLTEEEEEGRHWDGQDEQSRIVLPPENCWRQGRGADLTLVRLE